jgi:hypothetical protein
MANDKELLKEIQTDIVNFYYEYASLYNTIEAYTEVSNFLENYEVDFMGKNFLLTSNEALVDSMMMAFARLYDNNNCSKNIQFLIKECINSCKSANDSKTLCVELNKIRNELSANQIISDAIKIIKFRRNKHYAHNDKIFFRKPEKDTTYLPMYKLWILRDFTKNLLELLANNFDVRLDYNLLRINDFKYLRDLILQKSLTE